jgi:hypothetical protein
MRRNLSLTNSQEAMVATAVGSLPPWQRRQFMRILQDAVEILDHPSDYAVQAAIRVAMTAVTNGGHGGDHSGEDAA